MLKSDSQRGIVVPAWHVGKELYDLHYGWAPVYRECVVAAGSVVQWWHTSNPSAFHLPTERFSAFLSAVAREADKFYTNKMLMLIAEPFDDEWWTAAWSYDGMRQGVCKIRPKTKVERDDEAYAHAHNTERQSVKARR